MMMRDQGHGVRTRMQGKRFQVHTPYDQDWIVQAHHMEGRWRNRSTIWTFPRYNYQRVAKALNEIFGTHLPVNTIEEPNGSKDSKSTHD